MPAKFSPEFREKMTRHLLALKRAGYMLDEMAAFSGLSKPSVIRMLGPVLFQTFTRVQTDGSWRVIKAPQRQQAVS